MVSILSMLVSVFGEAKHTSGDNYAFYCPKCNHHKPKLEIDIKRGLWHCWVCNSGGRTIKSLLHWSGVDYSKYKLFDDIELVSNDNVSKNQIIVDNKLPDEFISLITGTGFYANAAKNYLLKRGISKDKIIQYNIGYCIDGVYRYRIIVPSYDCSGKLNYFVGRSFMDNLTLKLLSPPWSKDIIGFELYVNWSEPIILVEGVFDAITVGYNAIPLFGKTISNKLVAKILDSDLSEIIVCLDSDAMVASLDIVVKLMGLGYTVRHCQLPLNSDPNSIGSDMIWKYIENASIVTDDYLLKLRLLNNIGYGKIKSDISYSRYTL